MANTNDTLTTVLLSSAVAAALLTSLTNLVISIINNHRLKTIDKAKKITDIDKYRYSQLHEMLLNWHNYDSKYDGQNIKEIASTRLFNSFLDNSQRYEIIRPLLDERFTEKLDTIKETGNGLLQELISIEKANEAHTIEFSNIQEKYFDNAVEFSTLLKDTINQQLKILLNKN